MNRWQKIAWFNLIVIVVGSVLAVTAASTLPQGERLRPPNRVTAVIIICLVLMAMGKIIFRKTIKGIDFDERDKQIERKAKHAGWMAFALSMVIGVMIYYYSVIGHKGIFSPFALPVIALIGGVIDIVVSSVAVLTQYDWPGNKTKGKSGD
jgi:uncharacterized membrane protein